MAMLTTCPSCGLDSNETRCPRCFTLKVVGCGGSCSACKTGESKTTCGSLATPPSHGAREDAEHPGTPLER